MNQVKGNGASTTLFQHDRPNKPKVSRFDLSRKVNFSLDVGMIVPIDCIETLPGDSFDISLKMSLDTLPLVAPSLTNYKIVTHWHYMKKRDMWRGWKTFSTKGRSGNISWTVPKVDLNEPIDKSAMSSMSINGKSSKGFHYPVAQHSLSAFLGVPPHISGEFSSPDPTSSSPVVNLNKAYLPYTYKPVQAGDWSSQFVDAYNDAISTGFGNYSKPSALPFVMYQSVVKNNYVPQNLLQDNHALFPVEGDDEWILPVSVGTEPNGTVGVANYIDGDSTMSADDKVNYSGIFSSDETKVDLRLLRYAPFDDDYFTTALPWRERGDVTTLNYDVSIDDLSVSSKLSDVGEISIPLRFEGDGTLVSNQFINEDDGSFNREIYNSHFSSVDYHSSLSAITSSLRNLLNSRSISNTVTGSANGVFSLSASQLRNLIAMSVWQERNARIDGRYNSTIYQHWAVDPRSEEHLPVYIGGTVDYLNFSTVIQNSESTSSSPLGSTAGFGSSGGDGSVCSHFVCPDHGYIMGVMIIKPETIYEQGIERFLTEFTFEDFPQPEFEGLAPQDILNQEVFVSGNDTDRNLFAYQERYTYYKVRQNVNRGLMQCKPDKDILFSAYTQSRWFTSVPKYSYQFCVMSPDNIRRDWLAYPSYPAFRCQLLSDVFVTRKLSYTSEPETFGF